MTKDRIALIAMVTMVMGYAGIQAVRGDTSPQPAPAVTVLPAGVDNGHPAIWRVTADGQIQLCGNATVGTGRVQCTTPNKNVTGH